MREKKGWWIRIEKEEELNSYVGVNDKCLGSIFLVERFPRQREGANGTCGGGLPMVGLIFLFEQFNLKSKVVCGEK
jgi:hypothetical protein